MEVSIKSCGFQVHSVVRDMVMGLNFTKQSRKVCICVLEFMCVCIYVCVILQHTE